MSVRLSVIQHVTLVLQCRDSVKRCSVKPLSYLKHAVQTVTSDVTNAPAKQECLAFTSSLPCGRRCQVCMLKVQVVFALQVG